MRDLLLAIGHHVSHLAFLGSYLPSFGCSGSSQATATRLASIDLWYGVFAGAVVIVGFCRAFFAAKGWSYYSHNVYFWAKIAVFAAVGLMSVPPTIAFIRWRKLAVAPNESELKRIRRYLHVEVALFMLLPIFAAAMARGYGEF